ncbi:hypothetical protein N9J01_00315 [bacterium]|nr:hypothetical protein [bacterium]
MAYTTINKPTDYFNTLIYTGNGSNPRTLTGVGFQPDWVWLKNRTDSNGHTLADAVRSANKTLSSDGTGAEVTDKSDGHLDAFTSDGFTVGAGTDDARVNNSGSNYVAWNWLASNTTASNTDGSITSNVSANTTSGFSIVSYTSNGSASQTVGHGLGAVPQMIISKNRDSGSSSYNYWTVYHHSLATANDKKLKLNETEAASTTNEWGDTDPTSTVYSVHTSGDGTTNHSSDKIIAYCFAEKKGFSKFGSYTGNGSTDGPMVYTGFKPAFVIQKNTSATQGWQLQDNKRLGYNPDNYLLQPHTDQSESALQRVDLLSNGFKVRTTDAGQNASGNNYIYMAFAESPFTTSTGVPTTAR